MLRIAPKTVAAVILAALGVILSGCESEPDAQQPSEPAGCQRGVLEADLEAQPMTGPAVDPATGKVPPPPDGSSYVVSMTYGAPKPGDAVVAQWGQLFSAIQAQLMSQEGLLALQLSASPSCGSGRTLAIWASVEAMYDFVSSPAHVEAMRAADEVLQPGFTAIHWEATTAEQMTLEEGVRRLAADDATGR